MKTIQKSYLQKVRELLLLLLFVVLTLSHQGNFVVVVVVVVLPAAADFVLDGTKTKLIEVKKFPWRCLF